MCVLCIHVSRHENSCIELCVYSVEVPYFFQSSSVPAVFAIAIL